MSKITLNNVRLSFPSIFNRTNFNGEVGKYEATFLLPKSEKKTYNKLMALIEEQKEIAKFKKLKDEFLCVKDGDEIYEDKEYAGYNDHWAIKASNNKRPIVLDRDKTPITEDDNILYAGCYVNVIISLWAQDNSYGKRINANLLGIQFVGDGEPFGDSVVASVDDFDDISSDYEDEDDEDI